MLKMTWFRRKKYLFVQMFLHHFLGFSIFKIFHTWSSYLDSKITIYNTLCWYSGKDTGLSPGRPQFKSCHHQGFLQKDLPWKFFKKWLSIRRITVWITSRSQSFPCPDLCNKFQKFWQFDGKICDFDFVVVVSWFHEKKSWFLRQTIIIALI